MAIAILFDAPGMTKQQYEDILAKLNPGRRFEEASDWPAKGLLMHLAGPTEKGWRVVDVWESEEAFRKFGEVLMPVLNEAKVTVQPHIFHVHKFVTG